jgi:serine/threonine protein kinase/tetratricopeptide (TPR) repeat protein
MGDAQPTPAPLQERDSLGRAFRFDADETQWYQRLRESGTQDALGRIGDYELLDEIGRGGQGVVFKARQPRTGREIAVKRLSAGAFATPEMRARFEREIEAAVALDHPNIVTVFGTEIVDGQQLLAMKWVDGVPVDRWAAGHDPPHLPPSQGGTKGGFIGGQRRPIREILEVFTVVCDAVHHAHQRGVIHRDLKPPNILVDKENRPFVLDFGLAKVAREAGHAASITMTGEFLGTPAYAAPEQIRGDVRAVDVRTDVYALGAILYRLLTGVLPFTDTGDLPALMQKVLHREALRPSSHDADLNREIDVIILKALAKDKDQRYASVDALADDLRRFLAGQAVLAHPPSTVYQVRKFVRQHRAAVAGSVAFVVLLLAATVTSTGLYVSAQRARTRALREAEKQKAVSNILTDLLKRTVPYPRSGDPNITVKDAVLLTAAELKSGDTTYPAEVEAELTASLMSALLALDVPPTEFLSLARRSVEMSRRSVAEGAPANPESYSQFARTLIFTDHFDEAEAVLQESLQIFTSTASEEDRQHRFEWLRLRGRALSGRGDRRGAEAVLRDALHRAKQALGEENAEVSFLLTALGNVVPNVAPTFEGESLHRRGLAIYIKLRGEVGRDQAIKTGMLGMAVRERGDLGEAERLANAAIEMHRPLRGENHPDEMPMRVLLSLIHKDRGKYDAAEAVLRGVVEIRTKFGGPDHTQTAQALVHLGSVLVAKGDFEAARPILETAVRIYREKLGDECIYTVWAESTLAGALSGLGQNDDAESLLRRALKIRRSPVGIAPEIAESLHDLGVFLAQRGQCEEAGRLLVEALALRKQLYGNEHPLVADTLVSLARLRRVEGNNDVASALLKEALAMRQKILGDNSPLVVSTREELVGEAGDHRRISATQRPRGATSSMPKNLGVTRSP